MRVANLLLIFDKKVCRLIKNVYLCIDSAWHLDLLVISFSVINYVVSMRCPS